MNRFAVVRIILFSYIVVDHVKQILLYNNIGASYFDRYGLTEFQSLLNRIKDQVDQESEQQQSLRAEEVRSQEQIRRFQRLNRELEDELVDLRRKEAESLQRKLDVVGFLVHYLCFQYVCHSCYQ